MQESKENAGEVYNFRGSGGMLSQKNWSNLEGSWNYFAAGTRL